MTAPEKHVEVIWYVFTAGVLVAWAWADPVVTGFWVGFFAAAETWALLDPTDGDTYSEFTEWKVTDRWVRGVAAVLLAMLAHERVHPWLGYALVAWLPFHWVTMRVWFWGKRKLEDAQVVPGPVGVLEPRLRPVPVAGLPDASAWRAVFPGHLSLEPGARMLLRHGGESRVVDVKNVSHTTIWDGGILHARLLAKRYPDELIQVDTPITLVTYTEADVA